MMSNFKLVNESYANIYESSSFKSQIVTQALLWEKLTIIDKENNWYKISTHDGYNGWVNKFYLVDPFIYDNYTFLENDKNWYWIIKPCVNLLSKHKSIFVSYGTLLPCFENNSKLCVLMPDGTVFNIDSKVLMNFNKTYLIKDVLKHATKLIGAPYLWGGKSSFGYDCSGLVQVIYSIAGYPLPRDCTDQLKDSSLYLIEEDEIRVGDLVYFEENKTAVHVGIFVNENEYLHSSGCVKLNSIDISYDNYDEGLFKKIKGFYRKK